MSQTKQRTNQLIKETNKISDYYNTEKFDEGEFTKIKKSVNAYKLKASKSLKDSSTYKNLLFKRLPILSWLPKYDLKKYLAPDIFAGCTTGVMNIPQGMAYALLAAVPAVNGLYISFFPCVLYVLLGTSPHISIGITLQYTNKFI